MAAAYGTSQFAGTVKQRHVVGTGWTVYREVQGHNIIGGIVAEHTFIIHGSAVHHRPIQLYATLEFVGLMG